MNLCSVKNENAKPRQDEVAETTLSAFIFVLFALFSTTALAQDPDPRIYEGFDAVPKIQNLEPISHFSRNVSLREKWDPIKRVGLDSSAQLLGFFHDRNILLAARDSAVVYYSGLLAQEGIETAAWQLVNISHSGTLSDPHLPDYLAQFGFTEKAAQAGEKFVFFDIAISSGKSFERVRSILPAQTRNSMVGIAISSEYQEAPSMFTALSNMFPDAFKEHLSEAPSIERSHREIQSRFYSRWEYGVIPQFTGNSLFYWKNPRGVWIPMSKIERAGYFTCDRPCKSILETKQNTIEWMQDLKYFWSEKSTKQEFRWKLQMWRDLRRFADNGTMQEAIHYLTNHSQLQDNPLLRSTIVIDYANLFRYFYGKSARPLSNILREASKELNDCSGAYDSKMLVRRM